MLPSILTIVIVLWMASTVERDTLRPVTDECGQVLVWWLTDSREGPADIAARKPTLDFYGRPDGRLDSGQYIPKHVADALRTSPATSRCRRTCAVYEQYVDSRFAADCRRAGVFGFVRGRAVSDGQGVFGRHVALHRAGNLRLPLINSVYRSVKKVTDFAFVEGQVQYRRVVAIEFPRVGEFGRSAW